MAPGTVDSRRAGWHRGDDSSNGGGAVEQHESCPDCHALVSDLNAHMAWHSRLVADLANAVEGEIQRSGTAAP